MSESIHARLRDFTETVLTRSGALVEWPDSSEEGLALLPPQAADRLGCSEALRLSHQPDGDALCANLATDFLDRIVPLLDAEPRVGLFQLPELYLKKSDMAEPVSRAFTWHNAKVVVRDARPARVEYHTWYFLASITSEDRWEDVFPVTVNARSGAAVSLPDPLSVLDLEANPEPRHESPSTYRDAVRQANAQMEQRAAAFVARLESRLERDRKRLREYYNALLGEVDVKAHRSRKEEDREERNARRRAVDLELRRKLAELDERYAVRAELVPLVLIRLELQALAVQCEVFRKRARKMRTIYWNPLLKELGPLSCDACGASIFSVAFTNTDVMPLCAACASAGSRRIRNEPTGP